MSDCEVIKCVFVCVINLTAYSDPDTFLFRLRIINQNFVRGRPSPSLRSAVPVHVGV